MTGNERSEIVERMARIEVDRMDLDTITGYAVDKMIDDLRDADNSQLADMWDQLLDEADNPFLDAK